MGTRESNYQSLALEYGKIFANAKEKTPLYEMYFLERVEGIEPSSQAWKARIISHYTIPACCVMCCAAVTNLFS